MWWDGGNRNSCLVSRGNKLSTLQDVEMYSEPSQTSRIDLVRKHLTVSLSHRNQSIDLQSKFSSVNYLATKLHLRCLTSLCVSLSGDRN